MCRLKGLGIDQVNSTNAKQSHHRFNNYTLSSIVPPKQKSFVAVSGVVVSATIDHTALDTAPGYDALVTVMTPVAGVVALMIVSLTSTGATARCAAKLV